MYTGYNTASYTRNVTQRSLIRPAARCHTAAVPATGAAAAGAAVVTGKPLVVVGSVNADLVLSVDRLPLPGETIGASALEFFPGGKVRDTNHMATLPQTPATITC